VLEPIPLAVIPLIVGQRSLSGSPIGPPVGIRTMLEFAARHNITPQSEHLPMRWPFTYVVSPLSNLYN
jgi:alcohol/geraniol dehydrogenase (NADP+)